MVSVIVENLGLVYRVRRKLTLAARDRRVPTERRISSEGGKQFVTALEGGVPTAG